MPIAYDVTNNVITVTGYSEAAPCAFNDLWTADKAGTLSLHARTGISAVDGSPINLMRNLRPADEVLMGGAKQDLYIVVTGWTNMTSATVRLIGTDENGATLTEDIVVTSNAAYYSTKLFRTLTQSQVVAFTKSDSGTFAYEVLQGQWGVVWKIGTSQLRMDCKLVVGDGATATYFAESNRQALFGTSVITGAGQNMIYVRTNAGLRLGTLVDSVTKRTSFGVSLQTEDSSYTNCLIKEDSSALYVYLYSLNIQNMASGVTETIDVYGARIWNCHFTGRVDILVRGSAGNAPDIFSTVCLGLSGYGICVEVYANYAIFDRLTTCSSYRSLWTGGTTSFTVRNLYARGHSYLAELAGTYSGTANLIDVDSDVWSFFLGSTSGTGKVNRQYSMDVKVTDKDNNPLSGATVTLHDKDVNQIFSATSDVNGAIPTQTVTRGYYDQVHGDTLQDYGPHVLTIAKAGYQTYVKKFLLLAKTTWDIKLAKAVNVFFSLDQLVLNLKAADPENPNVMVL